MPVAWWRFNPLDTLFFRDGRPLNAGEWAWVDSSFPPPGYTLQGAVRTAILTYLGADFDAFAAGRPCLPGGRNLCADLGDASSLGRLTLTGPVVMRAETPFFAAPLDLVASGDSLALLQPGSPVACDLGTVRLPTLGGRARNGGLKLQEARYVPLPVMESLLAGDVSRVTLADLKPLFASHTGTPARRLLAGKGNEPGGGDGDPPGLVDREPRIGLARENDRRAAKVGMLYAIAPVRPRQGVAIGVGIDGIDASLLPSGRWVQRLGGEGKMVEVQTTDTISWPAMPSLEASSGVVRFKLVLVTPTFFAHDAWLPEDFTRASSPTIWSGVLSGARVRVVSACIGRPMKIGGWDIARGQSRDLVPFVPAGSVYFCEADAGELDAVRRLHGARIGKQTEYGFGQVVIGRWPGGA